MISFFRSLRFVASLSRGGGENCESVDYSIRTENETLEALLFRRSGHRNANTILAVTGLSVHGIRDVRMKGLCNALTDCGFNVVLPAYSDIENFLIRAETVDTIAASIEALALDADICPEGRLSLIAPSFSGGLAILAALKPEVSSRIKSVCTIGTFARVSTALEFLLGQQDNDEYGRMIILKNYAYLHTGVMSRLERAFELAYLDNGFCREIPELDAHLDTMTGEEQDIFNRLRSDAGARMELWYQIVKNSSAMKKLISEMDAYDKIHLLKAPLTLIHGSGDNVIPPSESLNLHYRMKELGLKSRLVVTPLISHGDYSLSLSLLKEIIDLLGGFAFFIKHASRKNPSGRKPVSKKGGRFFPRELTCTDLPL